MVRRPILGDYLYFLPAECPTVTVDGRRCYIHEGKHYLPYHYDGGPVFIRVDRPE